MDGNSGTQPPDTLCVDIGGTSTKAGVLDASGHLAFVDSIPTLSDAETYMCALVRLIAGIEVQSPYDLSQMGVSVAGFLDDERTRLVYNSNLPWLEDFPLRERLCAAFPNIRIELEVDSNAAAVAEYRHGSGRGSRRFLCVTCGTGVGVGMTVDGVPLRFAYGCLGDMGHVIVQKDGPLCTCGGRGCAEAMISAPVLANKFRTVSALQQPATLRDVIEAARVGDPLALGILTEAGEWLGLAIASMANTLFPDRIAIAGGLSAAGELILEPAERVFRNSASQAARSRTELAVASLGSSASLVGAGLLFPPKT
ncbi:MAG TPA: ROK family protein [Bryobacteraceae bacterium]|nr:ROK family protein [Bryobacteraceae bacterium]